MARISRNTLRRGRHTVSFLGTHIVFNPKYRRKVLKGEIADECVCIIRRICKEMDIEVISLAVCTDHVHLFIVYPPKYSLSQIANKIKGKSSYHLRKKFPELKKFYRKGLWAPGCFHATVGQKYEGLKKYIDKQKRYPKSYLFIENKNLPKPKGRKLK
jgi:putative transposase